MKYSKLLALIGYCGGVSIDRRSNMFVQIDDPVARSNEEATTVVDNA